MDSASTGDLPFRATPTSIASRYSGEVDPRAAFFTTGDAEKLVYCSAEVADHLRRQLGCSAVVIGTGAHIDMERVGRDLSDRGVGRLMIEGGGNIHTQPGSVSWWVARGAGCG